MNDLIPVFVDCNQSTLQIDIKDLKKKIDKDVEAMIVHYGGASDNLKEIIKLLKEKSIKIIEVLLIHKAENIKIKNLARLVISDVFLLKKKRNDYW